MMHVYIVWYVCVPRVCVAVWTGMPGGALPPTPNPQPNPPKQVAIWHKIGRLRRAKFPNPKGLSRDIALFGLTAGRLMADTYLTAREHLRETTYSLTHLATSQLRLPHPRVQIDPMQVC